MNGIKREVLGTIWRLCEQMSYAAEQGHVETLKAQYDSLKKYMARLEMVANML